MTLSTTIQTIDDLDVSPGSGYVASFIYSFHQPGSSATVVERDEGPVVTAVAPGLYRLSPLEITIEDDVDPDAYQVALFQALDTTEEAKALVISDADGTNRRYVMFVTEALQQKPGTGGLAYAATLIVHEDVRWRGETEVVESLNWTVSGSTHDVTVGSHLPVYPTYTITPRSAKASPGWPNMLYSVVQWRTSLVMRSAHPLEITGGGWNTAALVTSGDLSNNGNIGVLNEDGLFIPFWYGAADGAAGGFNSTTTKLWVNHRDQAEWRLSLVDFLDAGDLSARVRYATVDGSFPFTSGWLKIDDEYISFNGKANGMLLNVMRGVGGTTPADHDAGSLMEKVSVYRIVYGPTSSIPPRLRNAVYGAGSLTEPLIDKAASSNSMWKQTVFRDGFRTAAWRFVGTKADAFTEATSSPNNEIGGSFVEPWTAMGFRHDISRYSMYFGDYNIPLKTVRIIGNRYGFGYEIDYPGAPQLVAALENTPTRIALWDAGADAEVDEFDETFNISAFPVRRLRYDVPNTNHIQTDIQQIYVTFDDDSTPIVTLISTGNSYDMAMTLANLTTGETIVIDVADVAIDESIVINTADSTVTYTGDNSSRYAGVTQDVARPFFLKLVPGVNKLALYEAGMTDVDIEVRYTPRFYK